MLDDLRRVNPGPAWPGPIGSRITFAGGGALAAVVLDCVEIGRGVAGSTLPMIRARASAYVACFSLIYHPTRKEMIWVERQCGNAFIDVLGFDHARIACHI